MQIDREPDYKNEKAGVTLYLGDCLEVMPSLPDGSVDMVMTSPPYDNLRTYNQEELNWGPHVWKPVLEEIYRLLKDGGVCVWVVNDATIDGSETGTSFRQALYWKDTCGGNIHDTMIWNKGGFTAVGSVQCRYGPSIEFMFVFSKGRPSAFNPLCDRRNKEHKVGRPVKSGTVRMPNGTTKATTHEARKTAAYGVRFNVWEVSAVHGYGGHPATFPTSLATDHIISWSNEGDVVLDPFTGSGTTGHACMNLARKFIGIELDAGYFEIARNRLDRERRKAKLF